MATGDQNDLNNRILVLLPSWFPSSSPIMLSVVSAIAFQLAFIYSLFSYAKAQMRLLTATDGFLDTWAADFFGTLIQRKAGQSDASWLNTIIVNLFIDRVTRQAAINVLTNLTTFAPLIFEPTFPQSQQTGGYGVACGYGTAGAYASLAFPYQAFITVNVPEDGSVLKADIFAAVESVRPIGVTAWIKIIDPVIYLTTESGLILSTESGIPLVAEQAYN